jgi:hypothetical protein
MRPVEPLTIRRRETFALRALRHLTTATEPHPSSLWCRLAGRELYRRGLLTYPEVRSVDPSFYDARYEPLGQLAPGTPSCVLADCTLPALAEGAPCRWCLMLAQDGDCEGCRFPVGPTEAAQLDERTYHPACLLVALDEWDAAELDALADLDDWQMTGAGLGTDWEPYAAVRRRALDVLGIVEPVPSPRPLAELPL